MGKRVGLLAGLLVLALGIGAMAQEPSPEATALHAPEDLALALPTQLDGVELSVLSYTGQDALNLTTEANRSVFQRILSDLDKAPDDLHMVAAVRLSDDPADQVAFGVLVIRVEGVPAEVFHDRLMWATAEAVGDDLPPNHEWPTLTVGDRVVQTSSNPGDESWSFFYPVGEVLFMADGSGGLTMEDVLAELP